MALDDSVYAVFQRLQRHTESLHGVIAAFALWGGLTILALLVLATWWFSARRQPDQGRSVAVVGLAGVASIVALLINQRVLSPQIARIRPCHVIRSSTSILPCGADYSMPSDHAVIAGALAVGLLLVDRKIGTVAIMVALLLAASRIYVGVHYPTDVCVGLIAGGLVTAVLVTALIRPTTALCRRLARSRLRPLVTVMAPPTAAWAPGAVEAEQHATASAIEEHPTGHQKGAGLRP